MLGSRWRLSYCFGLWLIVFQNNLTPALKTTSAMQLHPSLIYCHFSYHITSKRWCTRAQNYQSRFVPRIWLLLLGMGCRMGCDMGSAGCGQCLLGVCSPVARMQSAGLYCIVLCFMDKPCLVCRGCEYAWEHIHVFPVVWKNAISSMHFGTETLVAWSMPNQWRFLPPTQWELQVKQAKRAKRIPHAQVHYVRVFGRGKPLFIALSTLRT